MLTPLAVAVLGLLRERPMHPYEMQQLLLERHRDVFFKVRPGSLYHTVDRLQSQSLIEPAGTERCGNRPERTTYRITDEGNRTVQSWVREQLAAPQPEYPSYPYALTEAHNLTPEDAADALRERCAALTERLGSLTSTMDSKAPDGRIYRIGGEQLIAMVRAELDWTQTLIDDIENKEFPWHPLT